MKPATLLLLIAAVGVAMLTASVSTVKAAPPAVETQWHWVSPINTIIDIGSITSNTGWVDVDLTSVTSATTSMVMLKLYGNGYYGSNGNCWFNIRPNGDSSIGVFFIVPYLQITWVPIQAMFLMAVDADEILEYQVDPTGSSGAVLFFQLQLAAYLDEVPATATPTPTNTPTATATGPATHTPTITPTVATPSVIGTPYYTGEISYGDMGRTTVLLVILVVLVLGFLAWLVITLLQKRGKA